MDPRDDRDSGRMGGEVARKVTGSQVMPCGGFASESQLHEKNEDPQGDASHLRGRGGRIEKAPEQGAGEHGT